jgi:hypothetical protein
VTNRFGEFREEILNTDDLELAFIGPAEKPFVISLRDALGQQSGDPVLQQRGGIWLSKKPEPICTRFAMNITLR